MVNPARNSLDRLHPSDPQVLTRAADAMMMDAKLWQPAGRPGFVKATLELDIDRRTTVGKVMMRLGVERMLMKLEDDAAAVIRYGHADGSFSDADNRDKGAVSATITVDERVLKACQDKIVSARTGGAGMGGTGGRQ